MHKSSLNVRGVNQIKTRIGALENTSSTFKEYMRITALELERTRLAAERQNLATRIQTIEKRMMALEKEKDALLDTIDDTDDRKIAATQEPLKAANGTGSLHRRRQRRAAPARPHTDGGFRLSY
jgi:predicted  nucleic acid-binding Zn-ribbon protein